MDGEPLPLVVMSIGYFDRKAPRNVAVRKHFRLDWNLLTNEQRIEVLHILDRDKSAVSPRGFNETVFTVTSKPQNVGNEIIRFRSAFVESSPDAVDEVMKNQFGKGSFRTVSAPHGYSEDENGQQISMREIMQILSGQEETVLYGDPESVCSLGPVAPINVSDWSIGKANTIAQFLDVVERITQSEWYRSPASISFVNREGSSELLQAVFPNDRQTMSVLAYFRQLHAKDELLAKACEVYMHHVGHHLKELWVGVTLQSFRQVVDEPPFGLSAVTHSRRKIIKMFMYGAGMLHSESDHGDDIALADLVEKVGRHEVVTIFNQSLMDIYRFASALYHVIRQDFGCWITADGLTAPSRVSIPDLFEGFTSHGPDSSATEN